MRYIKLLPDIELYDLVTGELWAGPDGRQPTPIIMTNKQFLLGRLADGYWGTSYQLGKQQEKLVALVKAAHVYVPVEDADWSELCKPVRNPSQQGPYISCIMPSIMPFMDGVVEAPNRLPDDWAKAEQEAREAHEADGKSGEENTTSPPPEE